MVGRHTMKQAWGNWVQADCWTTEYSVDLWMCVNLESVVCVPLLVNSYLCQTGNIYLSPMPKCCWRHLVWPVMSVSDLSLCLEYMFNFATGSTLLLVQPTKRDSCCHVFQSEQWLSHWPSGWAQQLGRSWGGRRRWPCFFISLKVGCVVLFYFVFFPLM